MTTYEKKDRAALFAQDKGPTKLGGLITVDGQDYRCKLLKAHPSENVKGYLVVELKEAPYSVVGGGFLWPSKQEGDCVLYGTISVSGLDYKLNLYKSDGDKKYVLSGPLRPADDAPRAAKPAPTPSSEGESDDW